MVERVRGIEPPLSAWESPSSPVCTDQLRADPGPQATLVDRCGPHLMARQWPSSPVVCRLLCPGTSMPWSKLDGHAELHKRGCCSCGLLIRVGGSAGLLYLRAVLGGVLGAPFGIVPLMPRPRWKRGSARRPTVPSLTSTVDPWSFSGPFWADYYTLQA
jgi:hypothetical protein